MKPTKITVSLALPLMFAIGCETPSLDVTSTPKWFETFRDEAAEDGYPDISAVPSAQGDNKPGALLNNGIPLAEQARRDFETDPRAQISPDGTEDILQTQKDILEGGINDLPEPASHITDADIAKINADFSKH